jgi:hypothetical protein
VTVLILTEDAVLMCGHAGVVKTTTSQSFVTVAGRLVLVEDDPEGRRIVGCPNLNPAAGLRPCVTTLKVRAGYSQLVRIGGAPVCLATVRGETDGTPPGTVEYTVRSPGQDFVSGAA